MKATKTKPVELNLKRKMKTPELKPVEFSCHAPNAQTVFVAGTFNDWRADGIALRREADGHWKTKVQIPPRHHEFKFIVDGQWCCDPGCEHENREYHGCAKCAANGFGTMNRILAVV